MAWGEKMMVTKIWKSNEPVVTDLATRGRETSAYSGGPGSRPGTSERGRDRRIS